MPTATTPAFNLGDLRRVTPIDSGFGLGRGKPVDRHYIEDLLQRHAEDTRGHVLEVSEDTYTLQFGGGRARAVHRRPAQGRARPPRPALPDARGRPGGESEGLDADRSDGRDRGGYFGQDAPEAIQAEISAPNCA